MVKKGKPVNKTKQAELAPAPAARASGTQQNLPGTPPSNTVQIVQGNAPVIQVKLLEQINNNIVSLVKMLKSWKEEADG